MRIGIISDTHIPDRASSLPADIYEDLDGVDEIIQAGDLTSQAVRDRLEELASVSGVAGNCDRRAVREAFPQELTITREGIKISVHHGYGLGRDMLSRLSYKFDDSKVIIFGHTHRFYSEWHNDQLFLNPGSPTSPRRQNFGSYALLNICGEEEIDVEIKKI